MRILIFHGYLLRGTGSNVYNASLARALAKMGHEVHLLCQDAAAGDLAWVDAVGRWQNGELEISGATPAAGSVTVYLPEIEGLLPVYVRDRYEGFEVKLFTEISAEELERYVELNAAAARDVVARAGGVDAALANHTIAGPAILARTGIPYAVKVHGSCLSYAVAREPRLVPLAREGVEAASGVLVGSGHIAERLLETVPLAGLAGRVRLGPPGVDVERFRQRSRAESDAQLELLANELDDAPDGELGRDPSRAAAGLRRLAATRGARVGFVGKLIVSKGVDLLLAAWPLVATGRDDPLLTIAGFGELAGQLEALWDALAGGNLDQARGIAERGRAAEGGPRDRLWMLAEALADPPAGYLEAAREAAESVVFVGRLEHDEVAVLDGAIDAQVVPSTFPEAFGMVAAEAASAGVLPVCAMHSGLAEVANVLDRALDTQARGLTGFELGPGAVAAIADRLNRWLDLEAEERARHGSAISRVVAERWSWERVGRDVIAASRGDLAELADAGV